MRLSLRCSSLVLTTLLFVPAIARPAAISVNGTCEVGNCGSVDSVTFTGTTGTVPFSFLYAVGADNYQISGNYSASYDANGTVFNAFVGATYTGSTPTATNDTLSINVFQNFFDDSPGNWDGTYTEQFPLTVSGNAGSGSTVMAQLLYDGQSIGWVGPFGPGSNNVTQSADLTGLDATTLSAEYQFVFNFAAGTQPGAEIVTTAVPEPSQSLLILGALSTLGWAASRRRKIEAKTAI